MSLSIRNLEESDLPTVQTLISEKMGSQAVQADFMQPEALKSSLFMDTIFALVGEDEGNVIGTVSILMDQETPDTVVGMLGHLCVNSNASRPAVAASLVKTSLESLASNLQLCCAEIPTNELWAQAACEESGFVASGFLPHKYGGEPRPGAVLYFFLSEQSRNLRRPHPELIPGARDLATEALKAHGLIEDVEVRDDVVAYPTECNLVFTPIETSAVQTMLEGHTPQEREIFSMLHTTHTCLHLPLGEVTFMAAKEGERIIGVVGYIYDPFDKRVQITDLFTMDGEPQGFLLMQLVDEVARKLESDYWEVLVSSHAPRMQKTLDQIGFVPCAYLPAFMMEHGARTDAVKMVHLTTSYESETLELTSASRSIFAIIDTIFREYSVGQAVIKLLRDLRIFQNLGEGELRRVARLFSQKLFRPGEVVFDEGTSGRELYVVERGEIEIRCGKDDMLLGTLRNGTVLGEIAFLNGEPRTARAISKSATIVRVIHRSDFDRLVHRESHLGLIFFQNMALDLAEKLKQSTTQAKSGS